MNRIFPKDFASLDSAQMEKTPQILREYGWDWRTYNTDEGLSQELESKIYDQMSKSFTKGFEFKGDIPKVSFANLLGIRDKIVYGDEDALIGVVGSPGAGKSSWAITCAKFIDSTFDQSKIIFDQDEFKQFLAKAAKELNRIKKARARGENAKNRMAGTVVVLDEGVYMIFSGDAMTAGGKEAQKLFSIIRALNLIVIVNITNFRKINRGIIDNRILGLWKIPRRGYMEFYSRKRTNNITVKNNELKYPKECFGENMGWVDKECQFWRDYEEKKSNFLESAILDEDISDDDEDSESEQPAENTKKNTKSKQKNE